MTPDDVLTFWIGPSDGDPFANAEKWWKKDDAFDADVRARFGAALEAAARGELDAWAAAPRSCVALVILLDQLSRNIHRGSARAFAADAKALSVARALVDAKGDRGLRPIERAFAYMPFMHAEDLAAQDRCIVLFAILTEEAPADQRGRFVENVLFAVKHRRIIERFGRFPHRNAALGRASTPEERAFLEQPGSSF
ncbi:MAG: DUF924 family protein [Polyangiaceae bacterium]